MKFDTAFISPDRKTVITGKKKIYPNDLCPCGSGKNIRIVAGEAETFRMILKPRQTFLQSMMISTHAIAMKGLYLCDIDDINGKDLRSIRLAPVYDLVSTTVYESSIGSESGGSMSLNLISVGVEAKKCQDMSIIRKRQIGGVF